MSRSIVIFAPSSNESLVMPMIRPAERDDVDAIVRHLRAHLGESGRRGAPHFAPTRSFRPHEVRELTHARLSRRLDEPNWGRIWLLCTEDGADVARGLHPRSTLVVHGHVELRGGRFLEELHRATLGIGIVESHRGRGHGRRLLDAAIAWAREQPAIAYVDLGVFADNAAARRLYERVGFLERGRQPDAFRIDGTTTIEDIQMTLRLR